MEPDENIIDVICQSTGATAREASILYHLDRVVELFGELPDRTIRDRLTIAQSMDTLYSVIGMRILRRDHPEGWELPPEHVGQDYARRRQPPA